MNVNTSTGNWNKILRVLVSASILEGTIVLFTLFIVPSDVENAIFAGFSLRRLIIACLVLVSLAILVTLFIGLLRPNRVLLSVSKKLTGFVKIDYAYVFIQTVLFLVLVSVLLSILLYVFPQAQRLFPFVKGVLIFASVGERALPLLIWAILVIGKIIFISYRYSRHEVEQRSEFPIRALSASLAITLCLFIGFELFAAMGQKATSQNILGLAWTSLVVALWFLIWSILAKRTNLTLRFPALFECITIWLVVFLFSVQVAQWFSALNSSDKNSFNLLADAFLHGRLYLLNPSQTYDLTFANGNWYVPFPPFPAIIMIPFVAVLGLAAFNTTLFSISLAALTSVVTYLVLYQMHKLGWIDLSRSGMLWLVTLLSAGTVLWWLSLVSNASFTSQVVTILFIGLAFLCTLKRNPAWLSGLCLAGAILSRPNTFVIWPALLAIVIQLMQSSEKKGNWRSVFRWGIGSAIPVIVLVGLLFTYNFVRFGSPLDFGYTNVNGAEWLVSKAQTYGVFSPHFIPSNLYWMFAGFLPKVISQCSSYFPRGNGMSLLLATPAFLYVFRKFKFSWWTVGSWISVILSIVLLSMYHNNGAIQISYRYVLDFAFPLIMLIAFAAGKRMSLPLKFLIVFSICINFYSIVSWFQSPC